MMTLLTAAVAVACFASFVWGMSSHFRREGPMPGRMRGTTAASLLGFAWFLAGQWSDVRTKTFPSAAADVVAMIVMAGSAALFWWAVATNRTRPLSVAFSMDQPEFVQQNGPYAYVRHPFYLSYVIFWFATAAASDNAAHWIVPIGMLFLYHGAARLEEAKFAASPLSDDYDSYKRRTGMLLPALSGRFQ